MAAIITIDPASTPAIMATGVDTRARASGSEDEEEDDEEDRFTKAESVGDEILFALESADDSGAGGGNGEVSSAADAATKFEFKFNFDSKRGCNGPFGGGGGGGREKDEDDNSLVCLYKKTEIEIEWGKT